MYEPGEQERIEGKMKNSRHQCAITLVSAASADLTPRITAAPHGLRSSGRYDQRNSFLFDAEQPFSNTFYSDFELTVPHIVRMHSYCNLS